MVFPFCSHPWGGSPKHWNEHRAVTVGIKADDLFWEHSGSAPRFPLGWLPDQPDATKSGIWRSERGGFLWGSSHMKGSPGEGQGRSCWNPWLSQAGMRGSFSPATAGAHPVTPALPGATPAPSLSPGVKPAFLRLPNSDSCIQGVFV